MVEEIEAVEENPEETPVEADKVDEEPKVSDDVDVAEALAGMVEKFEEPALEEEEEETSSTDTPGEQEEETPLEGEASPSAVLEALQEAGIEHAYADEESALKSLIEAKRKVGMDDDDRRLGRTIRERGYADGELDSLLDAYRVEKEKQQQREGMPKTAWRPPIEWSSSLTEEQQEQYDAYARERWQEYYRDPEALVREVVYPMLAPEMQRMIDGAQDDVKAESQLQQATKKFSADEIAQVRQLVAQGTPSGVAVELIGLRRGGTVQEEGLSGDEAKKADLAKARKNASVKGSRRSSKRVPAKKHKMQEGEDPDSLEWDIREAMEELGIE